MRLIVYCKTCFYQIQQTGTVGYYMMAAMSWCEFVSCRQAMH